MNPERTLPFQGLDPVARQHSADAAVLAAKTRGRQMRRYLDALEHAGDAGLSDHEAATTLRLPLSSICSIRNGLFPLITTAARTAQSPYGRAVTVWRLATGDERRRLTDVRQGLEQQAQQGRLV